MAKATGRDGVARLAAWAAGLLAAGTLGGAATAAPSSPPTPLDLFGPLYRQVEMTPLFSDSKTFADATPLRSPAAIMADYERTPPMDRVALMAFVRANFRLPTGPPPTSPPTVIAHEPLAQHIADLWPLLTRPAVTPAPDSSLLALPQPYVVPGGRFRELYYWDSYFTMLGLKADGRDDLVESMIDDFGSLIDRYDHIPNGTRTYYLSRSQPPFFFAMVDLSRSADRAVQARRLRWLKAEYAYWMKGATGLAPGHAAAHVVRLSDGAVLNRYFDARDTPRDESYREDVDTAKGASRPAAIIYHDLRSGAESGWDFSSRWLADGRTLSTIDTTDILPVDLNSLLFGLELAIAGRCGQAADTACAQAFDRRAAARAREMHRLMWDEATGLFRDYDWTRAQTTAALSSASVYPLFVGLASPREASLTAKAVQERLLAPGGLRTTTTRTGLQWDAPNGWAPLQWLGVSGLRRYGQNALADAIACRWKETVSRNYRQSSRLLEKYDIEEVRPGGGGEYPLQDGFGWTNGVALALADTPCP